MTRTALVAAVLLVMALTSVETAQAQTGGQEGERIARLEGAYEHLATKADIEKLRTEVVALRSSLNTMQWFIGALIAVAGIGLGFAQYRLSQKINEALTKQYP